jgi:hypothetical protein
VQNVPSPTEQQWNMGHRGTRSKSSTSVVNMRRSCWESVHGPLQSNDANPHDANSTLFGGIFHENIFTDLFCLVSLMFSFE